MCNVPHTRPRKWIVTIKMIVYYYKLSFEFQPTLWIEKCCGIFSYKLLVSAKSVLHRQCTEVQYFRKCMLLMNSNHFIKTWSVLFRNRNANCLNSIPGTVAGKCRDLFFFQFPKKQQQEVICIFLSSLSDIDCHQPGISRPLWGMSEWDACGHRDWIVLCSSVMTDR